MLTTKQLTKETIMSFFDNDNRLNEIPLFSNNGKQLTIQAMYLLQKATKSKGYWYTNLNWDTLSNLVGIELPSNYCYKNYKELCWELDGKEYQGTYDEYTALLISVRKNIQQEFIKRLDNFIDNDDECYYFNIDSDIYREGDLVIISPKIATFDFLETDKERLEFICK